MSCMFHIFPNFWRSFSNIRAKKMGEVVVLKGEGKKMYDVLGQFTLGM